MMSISGQEANLCSKGYQPCFEIHAIGEADGDLSWYEALSEEEQRLILDSRAQWQ